MSNHWTTTHSKACKKRRARKCFISKAVNTCDFRTDNDAIWDICETSVRKNNILEAIMERIGCICPNESSDREFVIAPANRYKIVVHSITRTKITLEQWFCHYEHNRLNCVSARMVVIYI